MSQFEASDKETRCAVLTSSQLVDYKDSEAMIV